ncbi:hypothetical protein EPI10_019595 [Gossypium australe]|uniref:Uncharacterized protein n=1 Tax=Gossypium australe TaxID=47621 RepID=A0A5B6WBE8_9ROSI|nr:hypothetical protein EPI10_019595 [Gossypium australe]
MGAGVVLGLRGGVDRGEGVDRGMEACWWRGGARAETLGRSEKGNRLSVTSRIKCNHGGTFC